MIHLYFIIVMREFRIDASIIFELLSLESCEIDTKIESVTSVFDEIRQVTEIVTSKSLSRSRASYT